MRRFDVPGRAVLRSGLILVLALTAPTACWAAAGLPPAPPMTRMDVIPDPSPAVPGAASAPKTAPSVPASSPAAVARKPVKPRPAPPKRPVPPASAPRS